MTRFGSRSFGGRFYAGPRPVPDGLEIIHSEDGETQYLWNGSRITKNEALKIGYSGDPPERLRPQLAPDDFDERLGQSFDDST